MLESHPCTTSPSPLQISNKNFRINSLVYICAKSKDRPLGFLLGLYRFYRSFWRERTLNITNIFHQQIVFPLSLFLNYFCNFEVCLSHLTLCLFLSIPRFDAISTEHIFFICKFICVLCVSVLVLYTTT